MKIPPTEKVLQGRLVFRTHPRNRGVIIRDLGRMQNQDDRFVEVLYHDKVKRTEQLSHLGDFQVYTDKVISNANKRHRETLELMELYVLRRGEHAYGVRKIFKSTSEDNSLYDGEVMIVRRLREDQDDCIDEAESGPMYLCRTDSKQEFHAFSDELYPLPSEED